MRDPHRRRPGSRSGAIAVLAAVLAFGLGDAVWAVAAAAAPAVRTRDVDVEVTVSADAASPLAKGDRFTYTVRVTNVGIATATDVTLTDAVPVDLRVMHLPPVIAGGVCSVTSSAGDTGPERWTVECRRDSLAPGRSAELTFDVLVPAGAACGPLRNVVEVRAGNEGFVNIDGRNRATALNEVACAPSVRLTSTAPAVAHEGDRAIYRYFVENDGDLPLRDVVVRNEGCDARPALIDDADGNTTLGADEIWVFRCTHVVKERDPDPLGSTAIATAWSAAGARVRDVVDDMTDILHPSIALTQSVRPGSGVPGDRVTYRYVVRNTGDTPLLDVRVRDDVLGRIGTLDRLVPGAHEALTGSMRLPADRILVRADGRARGRDVTGVIVTATDSATVTVVASHGPGSDGDGRPGPGQGPPTSTPFPPTAFTGFDVEGAARVMWLLGAIGAALVAVTIRRRPPPPCQWRSL
jgi:uncharacterized repeat protein (TIGR01451 family)